MIKRRGRRLGFKFRLNILILGFLALVSGSEKMRRLAISWSFHRSRGVALVSVFAVRHRGILS